MWIKIGTLGRFGYLPSERRRSQLGTANSMLCCCGRTQAGNLQPAGEESVVATPRLTTIPPLSVLISVKCSLRSHSPEFVHDDVITSPNWHMFIMYDYCLTYVTIPPSFHGPSTVLQPQFERILCREDGPLFGRFNHDVRVIVTHKGIDNSNLCDLNYMFRY